MTLPLIPPGAVLKYIYLMSSHLHPPTSFFPWAIIILLTYIYYFRAYNHICLQSGNGTFRASLYSLHWHSIWCLALYWRSRSLISLRMPSELTMLTGNRRRVSHASPDCEKEALTILLYWSTLSLVPLSNCPQAYLLLVEDNKQFGPVATAFHHRASSRYNDAIETTMTIRMMEGHEYVLV